MVEKVLKLFILASFLVERKNVVFEQGCADISCPLYGCRKKKICTGICRQPVALYSNQRLLLDNQKPEECHFQLKKNPI